MKYPELRNLRFAWLAFGIMLALQGLFRSFGPQYEIYSASLVFVHAALVLLVLGALPLKIKALLVWAFIARMVFMGWDLYAGQIFSLPNSGADSEMFYEQAIDVSRNLSILYEPIRGGLYSKTLGVLFNFIGPLRIVAHYINVLAGLMVVVTIYKILKTLDVRAKTSKTILAIAAFFPNSLIMSAILLREIIPTLLVAVSLLYVVYWYRYGGRRNMVTSLLVLALAGAFHSGVMGIFVGYAFFFLFYKHRVNGFRAGFQTVTAFMLVGGFAFMASTQFGEFIFGKFYFVEELDDILDTANTRHGASAYLVGMEISNLGELLLFGPVKMLYFIASPMPFDWRGPLDVFTFLLDSLLYIFAVLFYLKSRKFSFPHKRLVTALAITLISVWFVFGVGVSNAGTAIRHRQKIVPIVLVSLALMKNPQRARSAYQFKATTNIQ